MEIFKGGVKLNLLRFNDTQKPIGLHGLPCQVKFAFRDFINPCNIVVYTCCELSADVRCPLGEPPACRKYFISKM